MSTVSINSAAMVCVAAAALAAMILAPATRRLRPSSRRPASPVGPDIRRSHQPVPDYAVVLEAIARQVRSGSSLTSAVLDEIDQSSPLGPLVDRLQEGGSLANALAATEVHQPDLVLAVQALSATAHLGGPIAATLDEAAAVLRERAAARAERRAHGSQARLSARVLTVVPLAFAAWSALASQRTRDVYISTAAGSICALCGLALNVLGWQWMKRIIEPS